MGSFRFACKNFLVRHLHIFLVRMHFWCCSFWLYDFFFHVNFSIIEIFYPPAPPSLSIDSCLIYRCSLRLNCRREFWILLKLADNCLKKAPIPVFTFFLINTKQLKQFQKLVILINNNLGKYKAPKLLDYYRFVSF